MPLKASDFASVDGSATAGTSPEGHFGVAISVTPTGLPIYYQEGPKRLYRVHEPYHLNPDHYNLEGLTRLAQNAGEGWIEVPSVTTVDDVIDKSGALTWWGQGVGAIGTLRLQDAGEDLSHPWELFVAGAFDDARKAICELLTKHKISTNHVRDEASDRGVNVHAAFEQWADDQRITPQPAVYPEHQRGYVWGLANFLRDLTVGEPTEIKAEIMVASIKRRFAGRYDLQLELQKPCEMVTRTYPAREDKVETIPAGKYRIDLKTSKGVYNTHYIQNEAYEGASIECGYGATDYRGIVRVTPTGKYELHINQLKHENRPFEYDDFLVVREMYRMLKEVKR